MTSPAQQRTGVHPFILLVLLLFASITQAVDFPSLTGRVVDNADLLSSSLEQQLTQQLAAHEEKTANQVVVVTLDSLQGLDIADYGYQLGRHWGIGQADLDNGVLLIVAPHERKVRIEVGYGLEATLTDALSKSIIENEIVPRFKKNDYSGGIRNGVNAILGILAGTVDASRYQAKRSSRSSDSHPGVFHFVFITLVLGYILRMIFGVIVSSVLVFLGNMFFGLYIGGLGVALLIAIIATVLHVINSVSDSWGSGGGFGGGSGYGGSGGFSGGFGGGGFSGGGGSFGGGGASGGW